MSYYRWGGTAAVPSRFRGSTAGRTARSSSCRTNGSTTSSRSPAQFTVPTDAMRRGDLSHLPPLGIQVYDPLTAQRVGSTIVRQPFAGNIIPRTASAPWRSAYMKYFPAPNQSGRLAGTEQLRQPAAAHRHVRLVVGPRRSHADRQAAALRALRVQHPPRGTEPVERRGQRHRAHGQQPVPRELRPGGRPHLRPHVVHAAQRAGRLVTVQAGRYQAPPGQGGHGYAGVLRPDTRPAQGGLVPAAVLDRGRERSREHRRRADEGRHLVGAGGAHEDLREPLPAGRLRPPGLPRVPLPPPGTSPASSTSPTPTRGPAARPPRRPSDSGSRPSSWACPTATKSSSIRRTMRGPCTTRSSSRTTGGSGPG